MTINFPVSKFLTQVLTFVAIFASSASVVRGQATGYSGSSSASTSAKAGDGDDAADNSSLFASNVSFGKIGVDSVANEDGTSTTTYESVDAEAEALARWTEHSIAVTAKAEVNNSTDQSSGEAFADARASIYTQVHIHSIPKGGSGYWQLIIHSILSGINLSASFTGTITTYDDTGIGVAVQEFRTGLNASNKHGDSTNYLHIESPMLYEGYTVVVELGGQAQRQDQNRDQCTANVNLIFPPEAIVIQIPPEKLFPPAV
jgi:hypothetical protein